MRLLAFAFFLYATLCHAQEENLSVHGKVSRDGTGEGIAGLFVAAYSIDPTRWDGAEWTARHMRYSGSATTDAIGMFEIAELNRGEYLLMVEPHYWKGVALGSPDGTARFYLSPTTSPVEVLWTVKPNSRIWHADRAAPAERQEKEPASMSFMDADPAGVLSTCGIVVDEQGVPVWRARVSEEDYGDMPVPNWVLTHDDGTFCIKCSRKCRFTIGAQGFAYAYANLVPGNKSNRIILRKPQPVSLKVVDAKTKAPLQKGRYARVPPFSMFPSDYGTNGAESWGVDYAKSDGVIAYETPNLGPHRIFVRADGHVPGVVDVTPGGEVPTIELESESVISGRVVDVAGKPIQDVTLSLKAAESSTGHGRHRSNEAGAFKFGALRGGKYRLIAGAPGYVRTEPPVEVAAGSTKHVTITLVAPARIEGTLHSDGASGSAIVLAKLVRPDAATFTTTLFEADPNSDGAFAFSELPPGRYEVWWRHVDLPKKMGLQTVTVKARDVVRVVLD